MSFDEFYSTKRTEIIEQKSRKCNEIKRHWFYISLFNIREWYSKTTDFGSAISDPFDVSDIVRQLLLVVIFQQQKQMETTNPVKMLIKAHRVLRGSKIICAFIVFYIWFRFYEIKNDLKWLTNDDFYH